MTSRVLYIDDAEPELLRTYAAQLQEAGSLEIECSPPPLQMDLRPFVQTTSDLFLVDYDLTQVDKQGRHADYFGGTLAARIREVFPEHPIVLLTRRSLESWKTNRYLLEALEVFDWVLFKDDDPTLAARILTSISTAFKRLRGTQGKDWPSLRRLLGTANPVEEDLVRQAGPPLRDGQWQVPVLARWLQNVLLRYPGVLYDEVHAATYVGLDIASFVTPEVQELFRETIYTGCFSDLSPRWWKRRLLSAAKQFLLENGVQDSVRPALADTLRSRCALDVSASKCVSSGNSPADTVCYVLNQPVLYRYSLSYRPDTRPAVMDEPRVSFKAIRESNEVMDELFDADVMPMVCRIRGGESPLER